MTRQTLQSPMLGRIFSAAIRPTSSQHSHFAENGSTRISPAIVLLLIAQAPTVLCIRKPLTKPFGFSCPASIANSTVPNGQLAGMAVCSGRVDKNSTRMAGCISMRCCPHLLPISTISFLATNGTNGGFANSAAIKSNNLAPNTMFRSTFLNTFLKVVLSIFQKISAHGFHLFLITRYARFNTNQRSQSQGAFRRCHT